MKWLDRLMGSTKVALNQHQISPAAQQYYSDADMITPALNDEVLAWLKMRSLDAVWRPSGQLWVIHQGLAKPFIGYMVMIPAYADLATWRAAMDAFECNRKIAEYAKPASALLFD